MSERFSPQSALIEQKIPYTEQAGVERMQQIILQLADTAMQLARTYRVPRYDTTSRESDSEHSVMVALQAAALAAEFRPDLNPYEAGFKAVIHELIEIVTRDVQTFNITDADLAAKEQREDDAVEQLCASLPPFIGTLVRQYQAHNDPHSRFVGLVDKTAPVAVDILGPGSKFMHEDYETTSLEKLQTIHGQLQSRYEQRYPEPELYPLHLAQRGLMRRFEQTFLPPDEYYEGPEYCI